MFGLTFQWGFLYKEINYCSGAFKQTISFCVDRWLYYKPPFCGWGWVGSEELGSRPPPLQCLRHAMVQAAECLTVSQCRSSQLCSLLSLLCKLFTLLIFKTFQISTYIQHFTQSSPDAQSSLDCFFKKVLEIEALKMHQTSLLWALVAFSTVPGAHSYFLHNFLAWTTNPSTLSYKFPYRKKKR